jgi:hypothetical protein
VGIAERDECQTGFARILCPSDLNKQILVTKTEQIMFRQEEARQLINMKGAVARRNGLLRGYWPVFASSTP